MAKHLKVIAACVVVNVGGQERYLYKGAVLPSSVERKDITRLKNTGLVAEVAVPEADSAADVAAAEKVAAEKAAAEKAAAAKAAADQGKADKAAGNGGAPAQK